MCLAYECSGSRGGIHQGKVMDVFAPEFPKFWLAGNATRPLDATGKVRDDEASAQQAAMQELVERVNAARSVV
jgi:hypothetical protein